MKGAMTMTGTRVVLDGIVITRDIAVIMQSITRHINGVITRAIVPAIIRIIIPPSRRAGRAPRRKIPITTTIMTTGGNEKSRVSEQFAPIGEISVLCPGFPAGLVNSCFMLQMT